MEDTDYTFDGFFVWFMCILIYMGFMFGVMGGYSEIEEEAYVFSTILILLATHLISAYIIFKER